MKKNVLVTLSMTLCLFVFSNLNAQVGIGTDNPTNTLHVKPQDPNEDPVRFEDLNNIMQGDSALLVVDPSTGVIRFLHIDSIFTHLSVQVDTDTQNEWQSANQVDLDPDIDIDHDGTNEQNVQKAIELLADRVPKGTFKSIGEARAAGLADGDSFWADPAGVFGCSGCIITLYPGMN